MFFTSDTNKVFIYSLPICHSLLWLALTWLFLCLVVSTIATFSHSSFLTFIPPKRKWKGKRTGKDERKETN